MTFKIEVDGVRQNGAEEVTIITRYAVYTLWTDGGDLVILSDRDFKAVHFTENLKQISLETV